MPRKPETKAYIKASTILKMQALGVYQPAYDPIIEIYAELNVQYVKLTRQFMKDYQYSTITSDGGEKKSPLVSTLEGLRRDILAYSDRLCLSPKANVKEAAPPSKKSKLTEAMKRYD